MGWSCRHPGLSGDASALCIESVALAHGRKMKPGGNKGLCGWLDVACV